MTTKPEETQEDKLQEEAPAPEGVDLPMSLMNPLERNNKSTTISSEAGSSSSKDNAEGGNNSDNSALVSVGNHSFGFNFDSDERNSSSPPNSLRNGDSDSDGGSGNGNTDSKGGATETEKAEDQQAATVVSRNSNSVAEQHAPASSTEGVSQMPQHHQQQQSNDSDRVSNSNSSVTQDPASSASSSDGNAGAASDAAGSSSHNMAADAAVANLHSIASAYMKRDTQDDDDQKPEPSESNGGYNSDDEQDNRNHNYSRGNSKNSNRSEMDASQNDGNDTLDGNEDNDDDDGGGRPRKKKKMGDKKREERNAREKERSFRISKQINELRALLSSGGVIVPKGTKSSVLTEAANYIRMLQQHQYRSEIDRHQLVQQIQMIGGGAHGSQAAQAIRHVAAKNGVWSLGNFGGVPPKSAMGYYEPGSKGDPNAIEAPMDPIQQTKIEEHEYRSVFNNCAVGMAIASMGGAFIDCNQLFCQLSNYSKQEVCALTIFNLTARQDLQHAFDLISHLISPPMDAPQNAQQPIVLRGAMNNRNDLGLGVALVKGDDGIAKFFCVTLIKNPASPFDDSRPIPATIELIQNTPTLTKQMPKEGAAIDSAPAFTTG